MMPASEAQEAELEHVRALLRAARDDVERLTKIGLSTVTVLEAIAQWPGDGRLDTLRALASEQAEEVRRNLLAS